MSEKNIVDQENLFWIMMWKYAMILVVVVMVSISSCTVVQSNNIKELTKLGVDPIAARCGIIGRENNDICVVLVTKQN